MALIGDVGTLLLGVGSLSGVGAWAASKKNKKKIEAVHAEVRSPSNGVTNGGYTETIGLCLPWLIEGLMDLYSKLDIEPRRPPPNVISPKRGAAMHHHEED